MPNEPENPGDEIQFDVNGWAQKIARATEENRDAILDECAENIMALSNKGAKGEILKAALTALTIQLSRIEEGTHETPGLEELGPNNLAIGLIQAIQKKIMEKGLEEIEEGRKILSELTKKNKKAKQELNKEKAITKLRRNIHAAIELTWLSAAVILGASIEPILDHMETTDFADTGPLNVARGSVRRGTVKEGLIEERHCAATKIRTRVLIPLTGEIPGTTNMIVVNDHWAPQAPTATWSGWGDINGLNLDYVAVGLVKIAQEKKASGEPEGDEATSLILLGLNDLAKKWKNAK